MQALRSRDAGLIAHAQPRMDYFSLCWEAALSRPSRLNKPYLLVEAGHILGRIQMTDHVHRLEAVGRAACCLLVFHVEGALDLEAHLAVHSDLQTPYWL